MHPDGASRRGGFTLLEALVATAVVALIFVPLLNGVVASAQATHVADRQLGVRLVLERLLAALPMGRGESFPNAAGRDGDFAWTVTASRGSDEPRTANGLALYRVRISVSDDGAETTVDTYRIGPP